MIKTLDLIYKNESMFSYLSRCYSSSGYLFSKYYCKEILGKDDLAVEYRFLNIYDVNFYNLLKEQIGIEEIIFRHSLVGYYLRFLDSEIINKVIDSANKNKFDSKKYLAVSIKNGHYNLRYCPMCKEREGNESYFHVEHLIPELVVCPIHGCELIEVNIGDRRRGPFFLSCNEIEFSNKDSLDAVIRDDDINFKVARYIGNVFGSKYFFDGQNKIGDFLISRLDNKYFLDRNRKIKNNKKLINDLKEFYKDLKIFNINESRLKNIFMNKMINVYDILLLAYFEKICVEDLIRFKSSDFNVNRPISWKVINLWKDGCSEEEIISKVDVKKCEVDRFINNYKNMKKSCCHSSRIDWDKLDKEACKELKLILKRDKNFKFTKAVVAEKLGIKDKSLRRYKRLRKIIVEFVGSK